MNARAVVDIVQTTAGFDALEREWKELFAASPAASPPLHWDWVREWWRVYGPVYGRGGQGLRLCTVRRDGRLLGVLPLYRRDFWGDEVFEPRRLLFLSAGEAPGDRTEGEYQDLLCLPGEGSACLAALQEALLEGRAGSWDLLSLSYVAETSPLHPWAAGLARRGLELTVSEQRQYPIADLRGGYEAYLARLSYQSRSKARREARAAAKDGLALELAAGPGEIEAFFEDLIRLHQQHWTARGKPGSFASARFTAFHRALCRKHVPTGFAVLARLRAADTVLAVLYGFVVGDKFNFYQSGRAPESDGRVGSPGTAAHLLLMQRLLERGVTKYDFLAGAAVYKDRLCTDYQPFRNLRVWNPTWRLKARTLYGGLKRRALRLLPGFGGSRNGTAGPAPQQAPGSDGELADASAVN
jgi:CelD/BcsL family acetyltransferase involved in cellulose biosynthesis